MTESTRQRLPRAAKKSAPYKSAWIPGTGDPLYAHIEKFNCCAFPANEFTYIDDLVVYILFAWKRRIARWDSIKPDLTSSEHVLQDPTEEVREQLAQARTTTHFLTHDRKGDLTDDEIERCVDSLMELEVFKPNNKLRKNILT